MLPSSAESVKSSRRNRRLKLSPSSMDEGGLHALQSNPGALVGDGLPTASDSRGGPKPATSRTMTATTRAATPFEKAALRNLVRDATCCGLLEALTACIRAWEVSRLALGAFQFVACGNWAVNQPFTCYGIGLPTGGFPPIARVSARDKSMSRQVPIFTSI